MMILDKEEEKKIRVETLKVIAEFCESNNICYYLAFGTLLGAIRENGMIKWDYDIDVMLPRPDYDRFIELFSDKHDTKRYVVKDHRSNTNFICSIAIVEDENTYNVTDPTMDIDDPLKRINVELYPIDGAPNSFIIYKIHILLLSFLNNVLKVKVSKKDPDRSLYKRTILSLLKIVSLPITKKTILKLIYKLSTMYKYTTSNMTSISTIGKLGFRTYNSKTIYEKSALAVYEGYNFKVPFDNNLWLSNRYGDYNKLPPQKEIDKSLSLKNYYQYGIKGESL